MELSQQLTAVGLVLALFLMGAAAARRRGWLRLNLPVRSSSGRPLELIDRFVLTPQHKLHLLRVDGRTLLIATHPKGVEVVETRTESAGAATQGGRP